MSRALVLAIVLLGMTACRGDLYAPGEPVDPTLPQGPYLVRPWTPAIRVIERDGSIRPTVYATITNRDHYPFQGPGSEFRNVLRWASDEPSSESVLPPVDIELETSRSGVFREWSGVDFVPAPGDTIVIDLRATTHVLVIDLDTPPEWERDAIWLAFQGEHGFYPVPGTSPRFTQELRFDSSVPDSFAITLPAQADGLLRARVGWSSRDADGATSVDWVPELDDIDPGAVDEIRVAGELRRSWVRLVRDGRPIPRTRVRIRARAVSASFSTEFSYSDDRYVRTDAVPVWTIGDELEVSVRCEADRPWFLEQEFALAAAGDTVVVDVGPLDLDVEVTDASGRPEPEAIVTVQRPAAFVAGEDVRADLQGRASLAVVADVYRITARRPVVVGAASEVDTLVHITDDLLLRLELPE